MKQPYVVVVTGGRGYSDTAHVCRVLDELRALNHIDALVQGGCDGADMIAKLWAIDNTVQVFEARVTPQQWHKSKRSGPIRNRLMLTVCKPDLLVAFPGHGGTDGCVDIGRELGIEVRDERTI